MDPAFAAFLKDGDKANELWKLDQQTKHLPGDLEHGLIYYRKLLDKHHAAFLAEEWEALRDLRNDAYLLAFKLNRGDGGVFADDKAMGNVLQNSTAAPAGTIPLWGQLGEFELTIDTMRVRCVVKKGLVARGNRWPDFEAHAVDRTKPFLSNTGYRSFMPSFYAIETEPPITVDAYVKGTLEDYIARDLKGKLLTIPKTQSQPRRKPATKRDKK
jgi:hypothetical protein